MKTECIFCGCSFAFLSDLKNHSAKCQHHPAVIEAKRLSLELANHQKSELYPGYSMQGLQCCLSDGSDEDALGHLGDLFVSTLGRVNDALIKQGDGRVFTLEGAFRHYVLDAQRSEWPDSIPKTK